jgi:hypothetical protein
VLGGVKFNKSVQIISISFPWQLIWAKDKRWGVKLTPAFFGARKSTPENYRIISAVGLSLGYHLNTRYYIGMSGSLFFNTGQVWHPYFDSQQWNIQLAAHLVKRISATIVVQPHAFITGISLNQTVLGYDWNDKRVYFSLQIF